MAAQDYSKMKNADLEALLKGRNLPSGGKKADMVARLQQADAAAPAATSTDAAPTAPAPTSQPPQATSDAAQPSADQGAADATANSEGKSADAPATSTEAAAKPVEGDAEKKKLTKDERQALQDQKKAEREAEREANEKKYNSGVSVTDIQAEIDMRKKRAEKWGTDAVGEEAIKKLERLLKFQTNGTEVAAEETKVHGLDAALPSERERKKRGRDEEDGGRGGKRPRGGRGGGGRGGQRGRDGRGGQRTGGRPDYGFTDEDRKAAEERKKRFAAGA